MGQIVDLYPMQGYDTAIEFLYAAIPVGDISDVVLNLPNEAQDAIIAGTLSEILAFPGQNQNLQYSEVQREIYERLKGSLRAIGVLGMGGAASFQAPPFGGRGNSFWPAGNVPWTLQGPGSR
jgi:hypothetical protein